MSSQNICLPGPGTPGTADRALIPTLAFLPGDGRGFYYVSFCFCFPLKTQKTKSS